MDNERRPWLISQDEWTVRGMDELKRARGRLAERRKERFICLLESYPSSGKYIVHAWLPPCESRKGPLHLGKC